MTNVHATLKNFRQSPRKVRLVVGLLRGQTVAMAISRLQHQPQKSVLPLIKLLRSATASAIHNYGLTKDSLKVKLVSVDEAVTYKRIRPAARGSAHPIRKTGSTIHLVITSPEEAKLRETGKVAPVAPVVAAE